MLDRSQTANLFSEDLPAAGQETDCEPEPPAPAPVSPTPRVRRSPARRARPTSPPLTDTPRPPRARVKRGEERRPWRERLVALRPRLRRARTYAPIAVLLLIVLANPAGCARRATTPATVAGTTPATAPVAPTAVTRTVTVNAPPPSHATRLAGRQRHTQPSGRYGTDGQPAVSGEQHVSAGYSPPAASPGPTFPRPAAAPGSPSPAPVSTGRQPPPERGGQADEFGFER